MNDQETFWQGPFGDSYTERNQQPVDKLAALFRMILGNRPISSAIEFGANRGLNMHALRQVRPEMSLAGVEINESAVQQLRTIDGVEVFPGSMLGFADTRQWDLAFCKGVLIHIAPADLERAYKALVASSRRYVLTIEYFSTQPQEIAYRGHSAKLWKRDFAGELMDQHGLSLIDYGFVYRRDQRYVDDDTTWFLMDKS